MPHNTPHDGKCFCTKIIQDEKNAKDAGARTATYINYLLFRGVSYATIKVTHTSLGGSSNCYSVFYLHTEEIQWFG